MQKLLILAVIALTGCSQVELPEQTEPIEGTYRITSDKIFMHYVTETDVETDSVTFYDHGTIELFPDGTALSVIQGDEDPAWWAEPLEVTIYHSFTGDIEITGFGTVTLTFDGLNGYGTCERYVSDNLTMVYERWVTLEKMY